MSHLLTLFAGASEPRLTGVSLAAMSTTRLADLDEDGISWAQAKNLVIDAYGHYLLYNQRYNGGTRDNGFSYLNSLGAAWADTALAQQFIVRGAPAYDSANDVLHVLLLGRASTDGIFLRRFTIQRDGSNNITGVTYDSTVNLVMDGEGGSGSMSYKHPCLLWLDDAAYGQYGALVACWSARNDSTGYSELRMSMCVLGASATAAGTAGNWTAPTRVGTDSNAGLANPPSVNYSAIRSTNGALFPSQQYPAMMRLADKSLFVAYYDGGTSSTTKICYKRIAWAPATNDWRGGLGAEQTVSTIERAGSNTGYTLKYELIGQLSQDPTTGNVYVGFASWKSNAAGDTWSFAQITPGDAVTVVDAYSAGGVHSYAPTGDCWWDSTAGRLVVSYIKTGTQYAYAQLYRGTTASGGEVTLFTADAVDIPYVVGRVGTKLLLLLREASGSPPYAGYFGSATWS